MRYLSFSFIFFIVFNISAQELKNITITDEFQGTREEFTVIASDKKIKHGAYKLYKYDKLNIEGNYSNNQKQGAWKEYNYNGKVVLKESNYINDTLHGLYVQYFSKNKVEKTGTYYKGLKDGLWVHYDLDNDLYEKGSYKNGKEIGLWDFYNDGELIHSYNFDNQEFIVNNDKSIQKNVIIYDDLKNPIDTIDAMPFFLGGLQHLYSFLGQEIEYPRIARDNGIEGKVYVVLNIDETGKIESAKIKRGIGGGCDEESVRVLLLTSGKWIPAYDDGKPIQMKITQPISFTLGD